MKLSNPMKSVPKNAWLVLIALGVGYCLQNIHKIKMNSNQANESDGSYHIRVNPLQKTKGKTKAS